MNASTMTRDRYRAVLREFDAILAHACALSNRLTGRIVAEKHRSYAETIFTKLICHALSLRKLSPTLEVTSPVELLDIGAACSVARTLIEAFDALAYIGLHTISMSEREMRILAWELHDQEHRLTMLEDIGAKGPDVDQVRTSAQRLHDMVRVHPFYWELPSDVRGKIDKGKTPHYLRSREDRNLSSGINHDYYTSVTMFLSQYVHTLPFALSQLSLTHAGDPGALQLIAMPLQYSMPFMAKAIAGIELLWPDARHEMPEDVRNIADTWDLLAEQGVKGVGS